MKVLENPMKIAAQDENAFYVERAQLKYFILDII